MSLFHDFLMRVQISWNTNIYTFSIEILTGSETHVLVMAHPVFKFAIEEKNGKGSEGPNIDPCGTPFRTSRARNDNKQQF